MPFTYSCDQAPEIVHDDRLTSENAKQRWQSFKEKLSPETSRIIEDNFSLAERSPITLTWCDYIEAPSQTQFSEMVEFLKEQLAIYVARCDEAGADLIRKKLGEWQRIGEQKTIEIAAKTECLEHYGPLPVARRLPGRYPDL